MRTTTQLNPEQLKRIREAKGFTQQQLANSAFGSGRSKSDDPASLLRIYQRIERTGRASPENAKHIAHALDIKVEDLINKTQVEQLESAKFIAQKIEQRVRYLKLSDDYFGLTEIAKIFHCELQELLSWDSPENQWQYLDVAVDLVAEVPKLEFLGKNSEIENILNQLRLKKDHFQPVSLRDSFWWVYSDLSESQTEYGTLVQNVRGVLYLLNELKSAISKRFCYSDVKINLSKEGNRERLEIKVNPGNHHYLFECTPCEVHRENGITWKAPTNLEINAVRDELIEIAMNLSDIVEIDGTMNPPYSKNLVCKINQFKNLNVPEYDLSWDLIKKLEFRSTAHRPDWREVETRTFSDKYDIATYLYETLNEKEKSEFHFSKNCAGLELHVTQKICEDRFCSEIPIEKYEINLGWENDDGNFEKAPWTETKRDQFVELRRTNNELESRINYEITDATNVMATCSTGAKNASEV